VSEPRTATEPQASTGSDLAVVGPVLPPVGEQPMARMRQRLARLGTSRPQASMLDPLFRIVRTNHPRADLQLLERAYRTAEEHHRGQTRISGDAYITHP
jgi:GTP diphosphokinase / guanosine-3',5'-bis(diphosphate) 3'-diphosphatase